MTAPAPSAAWPLPSLMTSLANAGWGLLDGREYQGVRTTLHALEALLPHKSASGYGTVHQIAIRGGLSERWTRRCLHVLEDMGLVQWTRGTIVDGQPQPSRFRVVKSALVHLIRIARGEITRRLAEHKKKYLARLSRLRKVTLPRHRRENAVEREALSADLTTHKGEAPQATASPVDNSPSRPRGDRTVATIPRPHDSNWPLYCPHQDTWHRPYIMTCTECRWKALTNEQVAEYEAALMEEEMKLSATPTETLEDIAFSQLLDDRYPDMTPAQRARAYLADRAKGLVS